MIAYDSNALTRLIEANCPNYDPATDHDDRKRPERVAAFRIFICYDICPGLPTVRVEYERIKQDACREEHRALDFIHFDWMDLDQAQVNVRAAHYATYHSDDDDCRVVAEAEVAGVAVLLSDDQPLRKHMRNRAKPLHVVTPSAYWRFMRMHGLNVLRRRPADFTTHPHPHANRTWWLWRPGLVER